jgi:3-dehydroquinate dehydratase
LNPTKDDASATLIYSNKTLDLVFENAEIMNKVISGI